MFIMSFINLQFYLVAKIEKINLISYILKKKFKKNN